MLNGNVFSSASPWERRERNLMEATADNQQAHPVALHLPIHHQGLRFEQNLLLGQRLW